MLGDRTKTALFFIGFFLLAILIGQALDVLADLPYIGWLFKIFQSLRDSTY